MGGPFVSNEQFEVVVKYVEKKSKSGLPSVMLIVSEEQEKRYGDSVKKISTQWCQPNWKESNQLSRECTYFDHIAGEKLFDWGMYKAKLLETYMKAWDITTDGAEKDADGKFRQVNVPCIPEYVHKLDPSIAGALIDGFFSKTQPSEEKLGN
jgi:hypothetical protein